MIKKSPWVVIGYVLVILGLALPLWGLTRISFRELSASNTYEDFKAKEDLDARQFVAYNQKLMDQTFNLLVDPFRTDEDDELEASYDLDFDKDQAFSFLYIPKLDIRKPVYLDATYDHLDWGVAQLEGSALPIGGKGQRSIIAGHRGWWGDLMFFKIDDLVAGDRFYLDGPTGLLEYEVVDKEVIGPYDWDLLKAKDDRDMVSLMACHPLRPPRPDRLLVNGVRVEEEKEKPELEGLKSFDDIHNEGPDLSSKLLKYGTYLLTVVLYLAVFRNFYSLIRYLIRK